MHSCHGNSTTILCGELIDMCDDSLMALCSMRFMSAGVRAELLRSRDEVEHMRSELSKAMSQVRYTKAPRSLHLPSSKVSACVL